MDVNAKKDASQTGAVARKVVECAGLVAIALVVATLSR